MNKLISNILASSSPRRKEILEQIRFEFSVVPSNINEDFNIGLPPEAFTEHWAREKAKDVAKDHPQSLVIGADTVVILDGKILGKPKDNKSSKKMLLSLSGRTHEVITGVSLININSKLDITFNERTYVSINTLSNKHIYDYINSYRPYDKAGSYGIQDGFSVHIEKIRGCYYNVMGFPVSKFYNLYNFILKSNLR
ncbi:MAG: septum formation protein Maf [bacterium TMED46]|nr:MAG: septum formation protein Maf [bacterium TMED46]|tara:strand:+ start:1749 stop:2336 length:588 start_codon:yes stop_codon:yes gene_type:complete